MWYWAVRNNMISLKELPEVGCSKSWTSFLMSQYPHVYIRSERPDCIVSTCYVAVKYVLRARSLKTSGSVNWGSQKPVKVWFNVGSSLSVYEQQIILILCYRSWYYIIERVCVIQSSLLVSVCTSVCIIIQNFVDALSLVTKLHIYCGMTTAIQPVLQTPEHQAVSVCSCGGIVEFMCSRTGKIVESHENIVFVVCWCMLDYVRVICYESKPHLLSTLVLKGNRYYHCNQQQICLFWIIGVRIYNQQFSQGFLLVRVSHPNFHNLGAFTCSPLSSVSWFGGGVVLRLTIVL